MYFFRQYRICCWSNVTIRILECCYWSRMKSHLLIKTAVKTSEFLSIFFMFHLYGCKFQMETDEAGLWKRKEHVCFAFCQSAYISYLFLFTHQHQFFCCQSADRRRQATIIHQPQVKNNYIHRETVIFVMSIGFLDSTLECVFVSHENLKILP